MDNIIRLSETVLLNLDNVLRIELETPKQIVVYFTESDSCSEGDRFISYESGADSQEFYTLTLFIKSFKYDKQPENQPF